MKETIVRLDITGTRQMVCVDQLSSIVVQQMMDEVKLNPDLERLQILEAIVHGTALPSGE